MSLLRQIGGSIGIAVLSTLLQTNNAKKYLSLISKVSLLNPTTYEQLRAMQYAMTSYAMTSYAMTSKLQSSIGAATANAAGIRLMAFRLQKQIFCLSFTQIIWTLLIAFGLALIPLKFVKPPKVLPKEIEIH